MWPCIELQVVTTTKEKRGILIIFVSVDLIVYLHTIVCILIHIVHIELQIGQLLCFVLV